VHLSDLGDHLLAEEIVRCLTQAAAIEHALPNDSTQTATKQHDAQ
jgi:hypothetical protein